MTAREELTKMQSDAWKKVSGLISVVELASDPGSKDLAFAMLFSVANEQKRKISRFIDSKTDAELEIGNWRKESEDDGKR